MRKGDIIINPYVSKNFYGKLNPNYATVFINRASRDIITCFDYKGRFTKFCVSKAEEKNWEIVGHIDFNLYDEICKAVDWSDENDI